MKEWPQISFGDEKISLGKNEYIGERAGPLFVMISYKQDDKGRAIAHAYIGARHRGDEAMALLEINLLAKAVELKKPIIHLAYPWNKPSVDLFERHGYKQIGVSMYSPTPIYEKTYPVLKK